MNGILVVNKEKDMTSRDVVNILSKLFHTKKIGHSGTLDPIATGVLVVCIGKSTKLVELLTAHKKTYRFECVFGILTDTYDCTGTVLEENDILLEKEQIEKVLLSFKGRYMQEVPIYSAVKVKGKKLYEYAREKKEVTLPKREVEIEDISLLQMQTIENKTSIQVEVTVSKGTYIRSLIIDIAKKLNTVACMTSLVRIKQGDFSIEEAYSLKDIEEGKYSFVDQTHLFDAYPVYDVFDQKEKVLNGCLLEKKGKEEVVLVTSYQEKLALYKTYEKDPTKMKPWKML